MSHFGFVIANGFLGIFGGFTLPIVFFRFLLFHGMSHVSRDIKTFEQQYFWLVLPIKRLFEHDTVCQYTV